MKNITKTKFSPAKQAKVIHAFANEAVNAEPGSRINDMARNFVKKICNMAFQHDNENLLNYCFAALASR